MDFDELALPLKRYVLETDKLLAFLRSMVESAALEIRHGPEETQGAKTGSSIGDHFPLILEMVFQRFVDAFLTFISDELTIIFKRRPEMLKSNEQISITEVLETSDRDELIGLLMEKKVMALAYKGLLELNQHLLKNFSFALFVDTGELARAAELVEKRNLLAHGHGYVNKRYLGRVPTATEQLGDRLGLSAEEVMNALNSSAQQLATFMIERSINSSLIRLFVSASVFEPSLPWTGKSAL